MTIKQRLKELEKQVKTEQPARIFVVYPGQEPPADRQPEDVVLRIVYNRQGGSDDQA
jgi:hypothetical protein